MRYFLLLLILSLALSSYAQDEGWSIVENCLGELPYPTIPQANWDFEGVIFSHNWQGVRAIRADVETSYFIAFEDEENFPAAGGFSPDGRWFAYPTGSSSEDINMWGDTAYTIRGITVVTTNPRNERQTFELPLEHSDIGFYASQAFGNRYAPYLVPIIWQNTNNIVFFGLHSYPVELDLFLDTGEIAASEELNEELIYIAMHEHLWLPDLSAYFSVRSADNLRSLLFLAPDETMIALLAEFNYFRAFALAPDGSFLAYIADETLYLANMNTRQIENLCIEIPFVHQAQENAEIFFSPDGNHLAFLYDGYPVLLNLETREMQILRYQTDSLMGWYPIPEN